MEIRDETDPAWDRIDRVRKILRTGADKMAQAGVPVDDVAIGALYALLDTAELHAGEGQAAIEWMRTGCDMLERSMLAGQGRKPA